MDECNHNTKVGKKRPRQAQANERLYDPDSDPDQHRGGAVCVPAVLDHHRLLQNRCGHQLPLLRSGGPSEWVLTNYQKLFAGKSAPLWQLAVPFGSMFSADGEPIYFSVGPVVPAAIRWMVNTVFMAVMSMILTCITAAMAGYALAKKRFVGRQLLFTLIVCAMALPKQVILIPLLREMSSLHLYNTIWAVIFPIVGWPFGVFLMKQFSEGIPTEMLEAARIDGASEAKTFIEHRAAHGQAGHRCTGHFYLHQQLERLLHAVDHAVQHQQPDHFSGHCKAAG